MTQLPDLFAALAAPFDEGEVKVRSQSNRLLHYVTARTVMNRLDEVLGPENWWDRYTPGGKSVLCELTIRLPDGSTLTKCDAGGYAGMSDSGDDDKSGYSDAFKRAAVKFGVGRYLYRDGVPRFAMEHAPPPVELDVVPPPPPAPSKPPAKPSTNGHRAANGRTNGQATAPVVTQASQPATPPPAIPATGKALWGWIKEQEQRYELRLLRVVNDWGQRHGFPSRIVDYSPEQVRLAVAEVRRRLDTAESQEPPD